MKQEARVCLLVQIFCPNAPTNFLGWLLRRKRERRRKKANVMFTWQMPTVAAREKKGHRRARRKKSHWPLASLFPRSSGQNLWCCAATGFFSRIGLFLFQKEKDHPPPNASHFCFPTFLSPFLCVSEKGGRVASASDLFAARFLEVEKKKSRHFLVPHSFFSCLSAIAEIVHAIGARYLLWFSCYRKKNKHIFPSIGLLRNRLQNSAR